MREQHVRNDAFGSVLELRCTLACCTRLGRVRALCKEKEKEAMTMFTYSSACGGGTKGKVRAARLTVDVRGVGSAVRRPAGGDGMAFAHTASSTSVRDDGCNFPSTSCLPAPLARPL